VRGEIVEALREACGQDPVAYTRLVERSSWPA
jgi:hypothetical protein